MTTYIYTLEHPETHEIRYIGKTNNIKRRFYQHTSVKTLLKIKNKHLRNWILSIMKTEQKPIIKIIDEIDDENWSWLEQYWISQFKTWGFNLINCTDGGEGISGWNHTIETKQKMSKSQLGLKRNFSKEHIETLSKRCSERNFSNDPETFKKAQKNATLAKNTDSFKEKCRKNALGNTNMLGKTHSKETKAKISKSRIGKKQSEKSKLKQSNSMKKNIICLNNGKVFFGAQECADFFKVSRDVIYNQLNKVTKNKLNIKYYEIENLQL